MKIWVTGGHGMVGTALYRRLAMDGHEVLAPASRVLDLCDRRAVDAWLASHAGIRVVVHLAGRRGGLGARLADPTGFFLDSLAIVTNVIDATRRRGINRLVFVGTACVYPVDAVQPVVEEALMTGPLEPHNEGYALARICGTRLCADMNAQFGTRFLTLHPCNLIGPRDCFDPESGQVAPSLIARIERARRMQAPSVKVWGSGRACRDFLYVEDFVDAITFFVNNPDLVPRDRPWLNVGGGRDVSIAELAQRIAETAGYRGRLEFDVSRPEGVSRRLLDIHRVTALGWKPLTSLSTALARTIAWYRDTLPDSPTPSLSDSTGV